MSKYRFRGEKNACMHGQTKLEKERHWHTWEMILGKNNANAYKGMSLPEYTIARAVMNPDPFSYSLAHRSRDAL